MEIAVTKLTMSGKKWKIPPISILRTNPNLPKCSSLLTPLNGFFRDMKKRLHFVLIFYILDNQMYIRVEYVNTCTFVVLSHPLITLQVFQIKKTLRDSKLIFQWPSIYARIVMITTVPLEA